MGNDFSKGVDSAVSIITGIITGDMTGGLAGASAPWLAEQIKIQAGDNETARLVAHAILGAVVAELQGNSALSGGAGAVAGEVAADIIRKQLYGKEVKDLTEEEKQTISALSQLATGLAIAAGGGNISDASTAIRSSKNAVENNYLSVNEAKRKAYLTWIKPNYLGEELTEDEKKELENLNKLDKERDQILQDNCSLGNISSSACKGLLQEAWEMQNEYEKEVARSLTNADLYREDSKNLNEALVGLDPNSIIHLISIEAIAKETGRDVKDVAQQYKYVMAAHGIVSSLAGLYGGVNFTQPNTNIGKPGNIVNKVDDIAVKGSIPEIKAGSGVEKPTDSLNNKASDTVGTGKQKDDQIWTETNKKDPVENAYSHWDKHKLEFPEFQNAKQYVDATHNFVNNPPAGTLVITRKNGDTVFYNPSSNIFAVKNADGTPKTMFKPNPAEHGYKTNLEYFNAQK
ncbi:VENN motif pre-toxin domain-containing protein [Gilliamella sp. M0364]|nr:VENN motif pre-toxin domain-containing protein [Gilliamella sp. M0364]MBI0156687.1 VENN motif pre-toxin domain-containing protein [Gilliamella sp. M0364]